MTENMPQCSLIGLNIVFNMKDYFSLFRSLFIMYLFCTYCKSIFLNIFSLKNHLKREPTHDKKKTEVFDLFKYRAENSHLNCLFKGNVAAIMKLKVLKCCLK